MVRRIKYEADKPCEPGFDCDDSSDALGQYFKLVFTDADVKAIIIYYRKADGTLVAHVMLVITQDGWYWILDPQSGKKLGPFPVGTPIDVAPIQDIEYDVHPTDPQRRYSDPFDPGERSHPDEPKPWWYSTPMREKFNDEKQNPSGIPWYYFAPPGAPGLIPDDDDPTDTPGDDPKKNPKEKDPKKKAAMID